MQVLALVAALTVFPVRATVETEPLRHHGDAADDPAIWVHPDDPARSTIVGTDKKGGLALYDIAGREIQYVADGQKNNVDLRYGVSLGGERIDVVVATERETATLAAYAVVPESGRLRRIATIAIDAPGYGLCLYRSPRDGRLHAFVTSKTGRIDQWELADDGTGKLAGRHVRKLALPSKTEGSVADDELGIAYFAEEKGGIWRIGAEPDAGTSFARVDTPQGGRLAPDIEGLALYALPQGQGYLIASSQGNNTFAVYSRGGANEYLASFQVTAGDAIDGAEDTDGLEVTGASLGASFPMGALVVQNGTNDGGNQTFLLVPWQDVASGGSLLAAADIDPRAPTRESLAGAPAPEAAAPVPEPASPAGPPTPAAVGLGTR